MYYISQFCYALFCFIELGEQRIGKLITKQLKDGSIIQTLTALEEDSGLVPRDNISLTQECNSNSRATSGFYRQQEHTL